MAKRGPATPFEQLRQSAAAKAAGLAPMKSAPTSFSVDFSSIPDPARTYYAQECWVENDRGIVAIFFAQKSRTENRLRSIVCIRMAPINVTNWLRSVDAIQSPSIADIAALIDAKPEQLISYPDEAEQIFEASANVARTGMSGYDATIDFIKVSPFEIVKALGGKARGEPQVRIDTRAGLFLALIQKLREMSESFPERALAEKIK